MKIAIGSDLHLEHHPLDFDNSDDAELLILSGDIMIAQDLYAHPHDPAVDLLIATPKEIGKRKYAAHQYREFLSKCSDLFENVVWVAGNHEFYGGRFYGSLDHLRDACGDYSNIHFLENSTVDIDEFTVIGATLWTDANRGDPVTAYSISDSINDYRVINNDREGFRRIRVSDTVTRHKETVTYFKNILSDSTKKYIIATHHAPSALSIHPVYAHEYHMNGAYHSDLSDLILDHPQIKLWTHGHMHTPFDYTLGEARVICNPRGYVGFEVPDGEFRFKVIEL